MSSWSVGAIQVSTVYETDASAVIMGVLSDEALQAVKSIEWLKPHYVSDLGGVKSVNQSIVVKTPTDNVVLDTCVGNGRHLTGIPKWNNLQTSYLGSMRNVIDLDDVDYVVNTHLHFDHIGWNTHLQDGVYTPTFPNAKYVFVKDEYDYWVSIPEAELADDLDNITVAVQPIVDAGLMNLVPHNAEIVPGVRLVAAPGHTPHHTCVHIESEGQSMLYVGDLFHHPAQIAHPEWMSFDTDKSQAYESRMKILKEYADTDTIIVAAHFARPAAGRIINAAKGFEFVPVNE